MLASAHLDSCIADDKLSEAPRVSVLGKDGELPSGQLVELPRWAGSRGRHQEGHSAQNTQKTNQIWASQITFPQTGASFGTVMGEKTNLMKTFYAFFRRNETAKTKYFRVLPKVMRIWGQENDVGVSDRKKETCADGSGGERKK